MEFWQRKIDLMVGGKSFNGDDFTINFEVPFSTTSNTDMSEIEIYNLSKDSIAAIEKGSPALLNVGYKGDIGNILAGKVEMVDTEWNGLDKITTITISDGGLEFKAARIQKTYQAGSDSKYIMQDLAGMLGLEVVEIEPVNNVTYQLGKTVSGAIKAILEQLVEDTDSKMYVNKGKLYIREDKKGTETGFILSSDSGLIGSPEVMEDEGGTKYNVRCLLNHKISSDSTIEIDSRTIKGQFRVTEGKHIASESEFMTELEVV